MKRSLFVLLWMCLTLATVGTTWAQEESLVDESGDLQKAMQRYFHNRLREELNLSDEGMQQILPLVERMEQAKIASGRERAAIVGRLQRGLRGGADDAELQDALDRLEVIEKDHTELQRSLLSEIDRSLSVRQRVQLRFFVERFRRDIQRRIRELREERYDRSPFDERRPRRGRR